MKQPDTFSQAASDLALSLYSATASSLAFLVKPKLTLSSDRDSSVKPSLTALMSLPIPNISGAIANHQPDHVTEQLKLEQLERLMTLQDEISAAKLCERIGQILAILLDESDRRNHTDAPKSDNQMLTEDAANLSPGDRVSTTPIKTDEYNLWAVLHDEQDSVNIKPNLLS